MNQIDQSTYMNELYSSNIIIQDFKLQKTTENNEMKKRLGVCRLIAK